MEQLPTDYPAALEIDYPEAPRDWFTTLLRPLLVVPIAIVLALVSGPGIHARPETWSGAAGGILFFATVLMLVFRQKYPGWWFDWNVALTAFGWIAGPFGVRAYFASAAFAALGAVLIFVSMRLMAPKSQGAQAHA